jgi:hypothetical protein
MMAPITESLEESLELVQERRIDAQERLEREEHRDASSFATGLQKGRYDAYWEVEQSIRHTLAEVRAR